MNTQRSQEVERSGDREMRRRKHRERTRWRDEEMRNHGEEKTKNARKSDLSFG
jgi:hypothetical protein